MGLAFDLHPKQSAAFLSPATELLFGGAAGPGKSYLLRVAAIAWCAAIDGLQVFIFRRTYPDLAKNHLAGPTSLPVMLAEPINQRLIRYNEQKGIFRFANGSAINLCHCQHEKDKLDYHGAELHVFMPDELTHFSQTQYAYLRGRVRMSGVKLPPQYAGMFPRIVAATNPGGVGHNWVKSTWIDPATPLDVWRAPREEGGMLRQFIPALLADNPTLIADDPGYCDRIEGIGDPALVRAMRDGDWNIVAGGMFDDVWLAGDPVIDPFPIPSGWTVDRCFDWGSSKPYAALVVAESNGEPARLADGSERHFPRGTCFVVGEEYGFNGKPNEGLMLSNVEQARRIVAMEHRIGLAGRVRPGPADSMIFAVDNNGREIAKEMADVGARFVPCAKGPGSRVTGWQALRDRLKANAKHPQEEPGLYVFSICLQTIRTIPTLPRDPKNRDDVDTDAEDHIGDALRYRLTAVRREEEQSSCL